MPQRRATVRGLRARVPIGTLEARLPIPLAQSADVLYSKAVTGTLTARVPSWRLGPKCGEPPVAFFLDGGFFEMKLKPLGDRLIVRAVEQEETTASGIVLADTAREKPQK